MRMQDLRVGDHVRVIAVDERRTVYEVRTGRSTTKGSIVHYMIPVELDSAHWVEAPEGAVPCASRMPGVYRVVQTGISDINPRMRSLHTTHATIDEPRDVDLHLDWFEAEVKEPENPHEERARGKLVADMLLMVESVGARIFGHAPTVADLEALTEEQWTLLRAMTRPNSPDKVPSETTRRMAIDAFRKREEAMAQIREHGVNAFAQMCAEQQRQNGAMTCEKCGEEHSAQERAAVGGGCPNGPAVSCEFCEQGHHDDDPRGYIAHLECEESYLRREIDRCERGGGMASLGLASLEQRLDDVREDIANLESKS